MSRLACRKRKFRDEIAAKLTLTHIQQAGDVRDKTPVRAYRCPECHSWHLTSKR